MLNDWLNVVRSGDLEETVKQRNLSTHAFCEKVIMQISV